jgi:hypothetical protein
MSVKTEIVITIYNCADCLYEPYLKKQAMPTLRYSI